MSYVEEGSWMMDSKIQIMDIVWHSVGLG